MSKNLRVALGGPLLLRQDRFADVSAAFEAVDTEAFLDRYDEVASAEATEGGLSYSVNGAGQAVIDVSGTLVHKLGIDGNFWGFQGYDGLERQVLHADKNPDVSEIVLDIDSGGGMVAGVMECARVIAQAEKPVVALVNEMAASAAYWLACAADEIVAVRGADVGSIGVISVHMDASGAYDAMGIDHTVFKGGALKDMGSHLRPVTEQERAEWQADIDQTYDRFVSWVSSRRPVTAQAVRDTEARVYQAETAADMRLIDRIVTKDDVLKTPEPRGSELNGHEQETFPMANTEGRADAVDQSAIDAAVKAAVDAQAEAHTAAMAAAIAEAKAEALEEAKAAADAEKERVAAVMALEEAKGRESAAAKLAEKGMSAEDAKDVLAAIPMGVVGAMEAAGGAGVDAGVEDQEQNAIVDKDVAMIGV